MLPNRSLHKPNNSKAKAGNPNFWTAGKSFSIQFARLFTQPRDLLGISFRIIIVYFQLL